MSELDSALCAYAEKATLEPHGVTEGDVRRLCELGLTDEAIHDAVQVIGYFNYINRVADCLGCDLEPDMRPRPG